MELTTAPLTNSNIFSVPDSDSETDSEEETNILQFLPKSTAFYCRNELGLVKSLESAMYTEICSNNSLKNKPVMKTLDSLKELQQRLKDNRQKVIENIKKRREEEKKELEAIRSSIKKVLLFDEDDAAFEAEIKSRNKKMEDAITYDKSRRETELAAEKEKAEKESKLKEEEEKKKKEEKEKTERELKKKNSQASSPDGIKEYEKHYKQIEYYKKNLKPKLTEDPTFRKQIFETKKLVKRTITQLQFKHHVILEKYNVMYNHLNTVKAQSKDAFEVLLNFLSKSFLGQVKQEVHATPFAAYFLARFAYLLISTIPEFTNYLLGRLYKRCPYLIPQYHDDDATLSSDEIRRRLHYSYADKDTKVLQNFLQHAEEQKCYIMFYGALCQTEPDHGQPENPYPMKHAWIWLARISNMPPREITPFLVLGMLEVSAKRLMEVYPTQTPKLLKLIETTILPKYPKREGNDNLACIVRLEMFLSDYFKKGKLNCVEESIPASV
ncbi:GLE1-like protein-domain-containing protein [Sporodiniella umbellata]|nr:GLE1-like protein-domain-containing protein [Sporodiniella umbellata]